MRTLKTLALAVALAVILLADQNSLADTITFKNGYALNGRIDTQGSTDDVYLVRIGAAGLVRIQRSNVAEVQKNGLDDGTRPGASEGTPAPAVARAMVQVRLRLNPVYSKVNARRAADPTRPLVEPDESGGTLHGFQSPASDARVLVLETPGAGTVKIARELIAKIESYRPTGTPGNQPVPVAAGGFTIATTHRILLKNGQVLSGNYIDQQGSALVTITIGSLGHVTLPRHAIERVERVAGQVRIPPEPEIRQDPIPPDTDTDPVGAAQTDSRSADTSVSINPRLERRILDNVYELTRNRTRNRVRAESALRSIGAPAIPYLASLMQHPFNLTRRSVMRIVGDVGALAGVQLAIDGLLDEDVWVRTHAGEALQRITRKDFGYRPRSLIRARVASHDRWLDYYHDAIEGLDS